MAEFTLKEGLIITDEEETELKEGDAMIRFVPLWKWLLREEGVLA
jgi:predicted AAA+ superfamily ATPase